MTMGEKALEKSRVKITSEAKAGRMHVMPLDREHVRHPTCWCEPELKYKDNITKKEVWLHRELH